MGADLGKNSSQVREATREYAKRPGGNARGVDGINRKPDTRPGRIITAQADRVSGNAGTQKYVVAVVLVPLSHVIVTVQFRNCGTAGTILRSYLELAGKAKLRLKLSVA